MPQNYPAPQVGLEPTTLRLTARYLPFSGLLIIAIYCLLSATCRSSSSQPNCGDYPQLPTILKESPHKIPHSELRTNFRLRSSRLDAISNTDRLRLMRSYSTASPLPRICSGTRSSGLFLPINAFCPARCQDALGKLAATRRITGYRGCSPSQSSNSASSAILLPGTTWRPKTAMAASSSAAASVAGRHGRAGRNNTLPRPKVGGRKQNDSTFAISV